MAQLGIDVTQMSAPATGAAKQVFSPIQDTTTASLVGTVGGMAVSAFEGYQMASLEKAQEEVIDQYIASKQNPAIAEDAYLNMGALDAATESLWERAATDANYQPDVEDLVGVEKELNIQLQRYQNALEQGVMSPSEFNTKILATTREAVNRTPGLYNELVAHSQRVLEMSGISSVLKADVEAAQDQAKQRQDLEKYYLDIAKTKNISVPYTATGSTDWTSLINQVNQAQMRDRAVDNADAIAQLKTREEQEQARAWYNANGLTVMNGELERMLNQGIPLMIAGDFQGGITQVRLLGNQLRQKYAERFGPLANDPKVKEAMGYLDKQLTIIEDVLGKAGSKEDAVAQSENLLKLLKNNQYNEVSRYVNPEALKTITSVLSTVGAARILDKKPEAMDNVMKTLGNVFSGAAGGLGTDYTATIGPDNAVTLSIKEAAKLAVTDPTQLPFLEKALSTVSSDLANPEVFGTTEDKYKFYEKLMKDLSVPEVKQGLSRIGSTAYSQVTEMIDDYMNLTTPAMHRSIRKWEGQGIAVELDALPDGRVIFKTSDRNATNDLNRRYTSRINDSLNAMANIMGKDTKSTATDVFYETYLPAWRDDPDLMNETPAEPTERWW